MRAIRATPEDNTPRLVYADWIQEHATGGPGNPDFDRAQFIRLQCEQNQGEAERVYAAGQALSIAHEYKWAFPLLKAGAETVHLFCRGFPYSIEVSATSLIERGTEIFSVGPTVTDVLVTYQSAQEIELLANCQILQYLQRITLRGDLRLTPEAVHALVTSPNLAGLRKLELGFALAPGIASVLAQDGNLPSLTCLNIIHTRLNDEDLWRLATSRGFPRLTELRLDAPEAVARLFLQSPRYPDLCKVVTCGGLRVFEREEETKQVVTHDIVR